jgi:PST family polysaccharide transporter
LQTPFLILGLFVASQEVGYMVFALGLSAQIIFLLSYNLAKALTPIFSNLQTDPERLASGYMRSTGAIAAVSAPLFVLAATMTPVFIPVIFGEQWIPAIGLTSILLIAQAFATTNSSSMSLLKGSGRFKMYFAWQVGQTAIFLPAVVLVCWQYGVMGLAWAMLVEHIIFAPLGIALCVRGTSQARSVLRVHLLPLIACIPLVPIVIGSLAFGANWYTLLLYCPAAGVVGLFIYVLGLRLLDRPRYDDLAEALGLVLNRVRRLLPGAHVNPS